MTIKIPVQYKNGSWVMISKEAIPVRDGATGELQLREDDVRDPELISTFKRISVVNILEPNALLMIAVSPADNLSEQTKEHLKNIKIGYSYKNTLGSNDKFVEVICSRLSLSLVGLSPKGIESGTIFLPAIKGKEDLPPTARSLNHALTILSEIYETNRISHTGNIYKRVFYKDTDDYWYPIEDLRTDGKEFSRREVLQNLWASINNILT